MTSFLGLFLLSMLAGFTGAMSGMGGGVVLVPALTLLGFPIKQVIGISIVSVIATSSGSASTYVRDHLTNLKVAMFLEMFTILGAFMGAAITLRSSARPLYLLFGVLLLASWATMFAHRKDQWRQYKRVDGFSRWLELSGAYLDASNDGFVRYQAVRAYWGGPLMFLAGVISGLLGVGAGAVKVLIHDLVMGLPPKVSTTTSNLVIGVTALAGASIYLSHGLIDPGLAAPVILGVVGGAWLGTRLLLRLANRKVRYFFLV
ncbi:MAG TPA: sulfite exporter TauE/SafE family protein, partial [bacterium]|nr:sulfite exporter TauE/SafE family protein [bacterium]